MNDEPPGGWTVRRPGRGSDPSPGERLLGYAVPMLICALVGGALVGYVYASGGPTRHGQVDRALDATRSGLAVAAAIGAAIGAGVGFYVARRAEGSRRRG